VIHVPETNSNTVTGAETAAPADIALKVPADTTISVAVADPKLRGEVLEALRKLSVPVVEENCDAATMAELMASVERLRPNVLILGLPGLPSDPASVVARILTLEPAPHIVAVDESADPEMILKLMRAGASEFVYPPFASTAFRDAMRRATSDSGRAVQQDRPTGSVIGFVSAKGGCGATTLACHAASSLRRSFKKDVLLADLDMASGITGSIMQAVARYSLEDALQNLQRMDLKLWKGMVATTPSGVDLIPAPPDNTAPVVPISRRMPQMLRFWRMQYDVTLIDFGHGITQPLLEVLDSIDTLVLVATNEVLALRQAKRMIHTLAVQSFGTNRLKLVINRMPKRTPIQIPELEKVMGHAIFSAIPNDYLLLNEAYSQPRLMDPNSDLEKQIGKFAAKLAGIATAAEEKKPRTFFGLRGKK
jgi:pilus assembly protein CpaE